MDREREREGEGEKEGEREREREREREGEKEGERERERDDSANRFKDVSSRALPVRFIRHRYGTAGTPDRSAIRCMAVITAVTEVTYRDRRYRGKDSANR